MNVWLLRFLKRIVLMALNLGLSRLSLGGGGGSGIQSLTMTGLTPDSLGDAAVVGDHASISVGFPSGVTAWSSQAWGTSYGDSTYGTGANPTTYVSGDPGNLYWEGVGDDGNTYRSVAPIRKAVATTSGTPDLSFAEDAPITPVALSTYYTTNGNTLTYAFVDTPPTGLSVNTLGSLSGTPTTATADANYTLGATDTYGRRVDLEVGIEITAAPVIAFASFTDSTDIGSLTTTVPNDGNWEWATVTDGGTAPTADGAGGWTGTILESGQVAVGASGADVEFNTTSSTGDGARDLYVYQRTSSGADSNVVKQDFGADNTAPTLSSVSTTPGDTTAALDWSTNEANGDAYWVLTTSATVPSVANIIAGNDHTGSAATDSGTAAVSATGAQPQISSTSLTNGNTYYYHLVHRDDHRNDSSVSTTSVTPAAAGITYVGWTELLNYTADLTALDAFGSAAGTGDGGTIAEGDLVIVMTGYGSVANRTWGIDTTGYTVLGSKYENNTRDVEFGAAWKVMGATPDTGVTQTNSGNGADGSAGIVIVLRGADSTTLSYTDGVGYTPADATPTTAGSVIIAAGGQSSTGARELAPSNNMTEIGRTIYTPNTYDCAAAAAYFEWTSGTFSPNDFSAVTTESGMGRTTHTIVVEPA